MLGQIGALMGLLILVRLVLGDAVVRGRAAGRGHAAGCPNGAWCWRACLAGVRGAITLAGVLTLPLMLNDGSAFPSRDLAITLSTGVILASLLIAAVALPLLLRGVHATADPMDGEMRAARIAATEAALAAGRGFRAMTAIGGMRCSKRIGSVSPGYATVVPARRRRKRRGAICIGRPCRPSGRRCRDCAIATPSTTTRRG